MTKLTTPNAGQDKFKLTGPAPLQSTQPVACGDAGCVFHHLDWYLGSGATQVSGCATNESTCVVQIPEGLAEWIPVYVRQDNDPKTLWALWISGCAGSKAADTGGSSNVSGGSGGPRAIAAIRATCSPIPKHKPKPLPKTVSTAAQKSALNQAGNLDHARGNEEIAAGTVVTTVGATSLALLGAGGLTLATAPVSFTVAGIVTVVGAILIAAGYHNNAVGDQHLAQAEKDPPIGGFNTVAAPVTPKFPKIPLPHGNAGFTPLVKDANALTANQAQLIAVSRASVIALDRSSGATRAHDHGAYLKQKKALVTYLNQESRLLLEGIALRHKLAAAYAATGITFEIHHSGLLNMAAYLRAHGLPAATIKALGRDGVSPGQARRSLPSVLKTIEAPGSSFDIAALLRDPTEDAADRSLAKSDRATARAVAKHS